MTRKHRRSECRFQTCSVGVDGMDRTAILLIYCPDRKGLVAAVSNFVYSHNGNILHADQHPDKACGLFLMRAEWELKDFDLDTPSFALRFAPIAESLQMQWHLEYSSSRQRVAIFVSQYDHCLADLLYRNRSGELDCEISLIIGNHPHSQQLADAYAIPFHYIPVKPDTKTVAERQQIALLEEHRIDVIVLARYMQILSPEFVDHYPQRIINVHHSFLPAFSGSRPYHRAYERGV